REFSTQARSAERARKACAKILRALLSTRKRFHMYASRAQVRAAHELLEKAPRIATSGSAPRWRDRRLLERALELIPLVRSELVELEPGLARRLVRSSAVNDAAHRRAHVEPLARARKLERDDELLPREHRIRRRHQHPIRREVLDAIRDQAEIPLADDLARQADGVTQRTTTDFTGAAHRNSFGWSRHPRRIRLAGQERWDTHSQLPTRPLGRLIYVPGPGWRARRRGSAPAARRCACAAR